MFEGIKSFIRDTQIKRDYPRYEKEQMMAHCAEAERRFDTGQLQIEVSAIKNKASLNGDQRFSAEIAPLRRQIAVLKQDAHRICGQLVILERDYKSELDELYARKKQCLQTKERLFAEMRSLQAERSQAHDDLEKAYAKLEAAKDDVNRWHNKSKRTPWLFGNGGKKLPKHALFGQSFGDLESAKSRRGEIVHEIGECKDKVSLIKGRQAESKQQRELIQAEIARLSGMIVEVKEARQRMFDLKNDGVRLGTLRQKLRECQSSLSDLEDRLQVLVRLRNALVEEMECRLGLKERENTIIALLSRKARFMDDFHSEQSKVARLDHHRRQWLASRGYR